MGIVCSGTSKYGFRVTLKSPQIPTVPSGLSIGTIGVAQSELSTFFKGHMQPKIKFLSFEIESSCEYFGEVL